MLVCLSIVVAVCLPVIDDPVFSGPQPGEPLTSFDLIEALGDNADQKTDLIARAAGKPTVLVFVHERTRPAFGLANVVMRLVESRGPKELIGGLVYLADDPTETLTWMRKVSRHLPKHSLVGVSADGKEGPGAYGLNRNVSVTVLVAKDAKVTANFALVQPSLEVDAPKIFKAIAHVLGEKEVPKVADFSAQPGGRMAARGRKSQTANPQPQDPAIRPLLSPLIQKNATDDEVDAAAKKVEEYVKKNPLSGQQIGDIARRIIAAKKLGNYGTPKCQEYLMKWAKTLKANPERAEAAAETKKD